MHTIEEAEKYNKSICHFTVTAYYPLIWIFHTRCINHKINNIHGRALKIGHKGHLSSSLEELSSKDRSITVHHRNLQILATEIHKILNGSSPEDVQNIFEMKCF